MSMGNGLEVMNKKHGLYPSPQPVRKFLKTAVDFCTLCRSRSSRTKLGCNFKKCTGIQRLNIRLGGGGVLFFSSVSYHSHIEALAPQ